MNQTYNQKEEEHHHPVDGSSGHPHAGHAELMTGGGHPESHMDHSMHGEHGDHQDHKAHVDHTGHEMMFRQKFWVSLVISIPVLVFSPSIQAWKTRLGLSLV